MTVIITGGIGSGKSEVCRILGDRHGFSIYEADLRVKGLYERYPQLLDSIEEVLGTGLRDTQGRFVPSYLASVIFSDSKALAKVESLVFPVLKEDFRLWKSEVADDTRIVFESATVLEKPQFEGFGDMVVLVNAPLALRKKRAMQRDADPESVEARMALQPLMNRLSEGSVDKRIDHVIDNSADLAALEIEIERFIKTAGL